MDEINSAGGADDSAVSATRSSDGAIDCNALDHGNLHMERPRTFDNAAVRRMTWRRRQNRPWVRSHRGQAAGA